MELTNFWHYKDLIYLLIRRDFVTSYKQTILGPFWVIIQALMGSAIFTVIFGNIAGLSTDGHPAFLFYLCGSLAWQYFGSSLGVSSNALQAHCGLFSKVHFPRFIPPFCDIISAVYRNIQRYRSIFRGQIRADRFLRVVRFAFYSTRLAHSEPFPGDFSCLHLYTGKKSQARERRQEKKQEPELPPRISRREQLGLWLMD